MAISVLIAEDHQLVRESLKTLILREGFHVIAEASNGREAIAHAATCQPDIAVLDMSMPIMNGLEAVEALGRWAPRTKSIVLTRYDDREHVMAAIRAGVNGYVLKSQSALELIRAMHDVCGGGFYLSPRISEIVVDAFRFKPQATHDCLTSRERQVLKLIAEGFSTKECAVMLDISVKTADSHRTRLMRKLDIHQTAGLVRYAIRHCLAEV
jgi:DNA-binding NarL/FixJ family response regulator